MPRSSIPTFRSRPRVPVVAGLLSAVTLLGAKLTAAAGGPLSSSLFTVGVVSGLVLVSSLLHGAARHRGLKAVPTGALMLAPWVVAAGALLATPHPTYTLASDGSGRYVALQPRTIEGQWLELEVVEDWGQGRIETHRQDPAEPCVVTYKSGSLVRRCGTRESPPRAYRVLKDEDVLEVSVGNGQREPARFSMDFSPDGQRLVLKRLLAHNGKRAQTQPEQLEMRYARQQP